MRPRCILVVEDNPLNLELVSDILGASGFLVRPTDTAEDALRAARCETIDLILMDIGLPGMDGLEAIRLLKSDPRTREVPVVALTAHAMRGDRERALEAGSAGYIAKPIDTRTFIDQVRAHLPAEPAEGGSGR